MVIMSDNFDQVSYILYSTELNDKPRCIFLVKSRFFLCLRTNDQYGTFHLDLFFSEKLQLPSPAFCVLFRVLRTEP
jgi:hypothetical protein